MGLSEGSLQVTKEGIMAPKRAINYARVSTPRQAELYSLDYQLDEMRLYDADVGSRFPIQASTYTPPFSIA